MNIGEYLAFIADNITNSRVKLEIGDKLIFLNMESYEISVYELNDVKNSYDDHFNIIVNDFKINVSAYTFYQFHCIRREINNIEYIISKNIGNMLYYLLYNTKFGDIDLRKLNLLKLSLLKFLVLS